METTLSWIITIFLVEIEDQVQFSIILSTLKQHIVVGREPTILVLDAECRGLQTSVKISFVYYGGQVEVGQSSRNKAFLRLFYIL
jgi:hypothetical protein